MMKKTLATLLCCAALTACNGAGHPSPTPSSETTPPEEHRLSLLFAGDLMQHGGQIKAALQADGTYSYEECFRWLKPEVERADVAIANFEVTLAGPPYKGYPQFSAPDDYLRDVINTGFDVLLTANNHCLDRYQHGLERTILMMDSLGVPHLGTYTNAANRARQYPFLLEKNGLRVVLLNFTYSTNGIGVTPPNQVNYIDTLQIAQDIAKARQMNPDCIIAIPHWGIEYTQTPVQSQVDLADWLLRNGCDHVIGGHPHVAEPIELRPGGHLVAYSLGNVVSNQSTPNTYGGCMVRLDLLKTDSLTTLEDCGYCLYFVSRPAEGKRKQFRIYPIDHPDSLLNATERTRRNTIRTSMRNLMQKHNKGNIKEYSF